MAKKRSPVHPSLPLDIALERASQLHQAEGEYLIPQEAVAAVWKMSPTGSGFLQAISTLKQFGLFEDNGRGEKRQFKLSELALDILLNEDESPQRIEALQRAALVPQLHRELWKKYEGRIPPQDASIRAYLLRQRDGTTFHPAHVDGFIERFRRTLALARLGRPQSGGNDAPRDGSASRSSAVATEPSGSNGDSRDNLGPETDASAAGPRMRELPVTLPSLSIAIVRLPERMTERDFTTLVDTIRAWKDALVTVD